MLVGLRHSGIFLKPVESLPVRVIPEETLRDWIVENERNAENFREKTTEERMKIYL